MSSGIAVMVRRGATCAVLALAGLLSPLARAAGRDVADMDISDLVNVRV